MLFLNNAVGQATARNQVAEDYEITERAQDHAVYSRTTAFTNPAGEVSFKTNQFTLLENALHYRDDSGAWRASEDLVEPFEGGAIARRGPTKAIFSKDINTTATLREFVAADVSPLISSWPAELERTHLRCYDTTWKNRAEC